MRHRAWLYDASLFFCSLPDEALCNIRMHVQHGVGHVGQDSKAVCVEVNVFLVRQVELQRANEYQNQESTQ